MEVEIKVMQPEVLSVDELTLLLRQVATFSDILESFKG